MTNNSIVPVVEDLIKDALNAKMISITSLKEANTKNMGILTNKVWLTIKSTNLNPISEGFRRHELEFMYRIDVWFSKYSTLKV